MPNILQCTATTTKPQKPGLQLYQDLFMFLALNVPTIIETNDINKQTTVYISLYLKLINKHCRYKEYLDFALSTKNFKIHSTFSTKQNISYLLVIRKRGNENRGNVVEIKINVH